MKAPSRELIELIEDELNDTGESDIGILGKMVIIQKEKPNTYNAIVEGIGNFRIESDKTENLLYEIKNEIEKCQS